MKYVAIALVLIVTVIGVYAVFTGGKEISTTVTPTKPPTPSPTSAPRLQSPDMDPSTLGIKQYTSAPEPFLEEGTEYIVTLKTNKGDMKIKLFHNEVPIAASNFAYLVQDGFYNGVTFHRVVEGFMIQGGDPLGSGMGGPGYKFADEPVTRSYDRGVVAYANSGPNSNGSQFFIMHADYPLPPQYVIFGEVVEGIDTVDAIATTQVSAGLTGEMSTPVEEIVIEEALLNESAE